MNQHNYINKETHTHEKRSPISHRNPQITAVLMCLLFLCFTQYTSTKGEEKKKKKRRTTTSSSSLVGKIHREKTEHENIKEECDETEREVKRTRTTV